MNIVFSDFNTEGVTFSNIYTMKYLHDYLDNDWHIVKKKNTYVLKKNSNKLIVKADVNHESQSICNNVFFIYFKKFS